MTDLRHPARWRTWVATGVGASVLLRLPMAWTPLSPDEGGYLAVARGWADGATLYRGVWVDRPQALLVLFRVWDFLSGGDARSVRLMAMLFGAVLVIATAVAVRALAGEVAGRVAAVLCGVVTATPVLEGYAANGELLAGAIAATAIAVAATAARRDGGWQWWFGAGVVAGVAMSLKQSAFDGLVVIGFWLTCDVLRSRTGRRTSMRRIGALLLGASVPLAVLMVDAGLTGWGRWWWAVVGYRLKTQSALSSADWGNLARTAPVVVGALGLVAAIALVGAAHVGAEAMRAWSRRQVPASLMLLVWPLVAAAAVVAGGGFWRHYWIQLGAPLSALAGVALGRSQRGRVVLVATALVPTLVLSAWVFAAPRTTWMIRAAGDWRAARNEQVADWFVDHGDRHPRLYVLCASAGLYAETDAIPHYPYLWFIEVHHGPRAHQQLVDYLASDRTGPQFVAQYQAPSSCDATGQVGEILRADFHQVAAIGGTVILERSMIATPPSAGVAAGRDAQGVARVVQRTA
jgi:4-amino-4-deoxy-L-arabinose transferase-like glycosyltransferase